MGTTPIHSLRYPAAGASNDVPTDLHNLAADVDAAIPVTSLAAASLGSDFTTLGTNTLFTISGIAPGTYKLDVSALLVGGSAISSAAITLAGTGATLSGATGSAVQCPPAGEGVAVIHCKVVVPSGTGSVTATVALVGTAAKVGGTGTGYTLLKVA